MKSIKSIAYNMTPQTKEAFCIAIFNRNLHSNNKCPGNYEVSYNRGWFYWQYGTKDLNKKQFPDITREADEIMKSNILSVGYSRAWNTYVLVENSI